MIIPEKTINYKCYKDGSEDMIGLVEATLPEIEFLTETLSGAGIAGEIESTTLGHTGPLTFSLNFRTITDKNANFFSNKQHSFELKAAIQQTDSSTGKIEVLSLVVSLKGNLKKGSLGKLNVGKIMETNYEFTCEYIKITLDGKTELEIDKLNMIFNDGTEDVLAAVRSAIGL